MSFQPCSNSCPFFIVLFFLDGKTILVAAPAGTEPGEGRGAVPDTGTETGDDITRLLTRLIAGLEWFIAVSPSISEADCYKRKRKNNARSPHLHPCFTLHLKKTNPDYEILNCQIFFWENYYWTWSVLIQLYKMQISGTHDSIDSTILSNTEYWILVYWILNYFGSNTILLITELFFWIQILVYRTLNSLNH